MQVFFNRGLRGRASMASKEVGYGAGRVKKALDAAAKQNFLLAPTQGEGSIFFPRADLSEVIGG
jgi:hypothetical protein